MNEILKEVYRLQKERDKAREENRTHRAELYDKALNQMALAQDAEMEARKTHD